MHDTLESFNSGYIYDADDTRRMQKNRPYCRFAFVTGFDNNENMQNHVLQHWSANMYRFRSDGPKVIARSIVTELDALNAADIHVNLCL